MKFARKLLLIFAAVAAVLLLGLGLMFTAPVQTFLAHRLLASRPDLQTTAARVDIGLQTLHVSGVKSTYAGAVLTLPDLTADISVPAALLHQDVKISKLVARGWTLDLTHYADATAVAAGSVTPAGFSLLPTAYVAGAASPSIGKVFRGVFGQLQLPVDLSLDGVVLDGEIILPPANGQSAPVHARIGLVGGGLAAGKEGSFALTARFDVSGGAVPVNALEMHGVLGAVMDSPRTFTKFTTKLDSQAKGPAFPQGVQLTTDASAARVPGGESYSVTVESVGKRLLDVQANFPVGSSRLGGVWRLDMRDTDLAPFTLGRPLPAFEATGAGMFETDTGFAEIHTAGRIKSSADRLGVLRPELSPVGAVTVFGEFDLTQTAQSTRIDRLALTINRPEPVLSIESLQPFEFNPSTGELKVATPGADLLSIDLQGVPLAWGASFNPGLHLSGGDLQGSFFASARNGGLLLHSQRPLTAAGVSLSEHDRALFSALDLKLNLSADYTPQGWQADITDFSVAQNGSNLLKLSLKAGRMAGAANPIKATGSLSAALAGLSGQPVFATLPVLKGGALQMDFSASAGRQQDVQGTLKLSDLIGPGGEKLPMVTADARATLEPGGRVIFNLPLIFSNLAQKRVSDLAITGTVITAAPGYQINARLSGDDVFIGDVQMLAALTGSAPTQPAKANAPSRDEVPFWHGLSGEVTLALKRLHYSGQFEIRDMGGTVHIEAGALKFDQVKAGLGDEGNARAGGGITFDGAAQQPYRLNTDVSVTDFDPAPLFKAINPARPPQVEGHFDLTTRLTSQAVNVAGLISHAQGNLQLTSKGGVFRLLAADVSTKVETAGKIASIGAFIGNVASALGRGKEAENFSSNAQAVAEFVTMLSAIKYDQLNVVMSRDDDLNMLLNDFTLIAPEIRLEGNGQVTAKPGVDLLAQPLSMTFQMKARGHTGDIMRYLHALDAPPDALGYASCNLPLNVTGTLANPDTKEIQNALTKLAVERSGAGDFLNKLLGK